MFVRSRTPGRFRATLSVAGFPELVKRLYDAYGPRRLMGHRLPIIERWRSTSSSHLVRDDMKFLNAEDKSWMLSKTSSGCGLPGVAWNARTRTTGPALGRSVKTVISS